MARIGNWDVTLNKQGWFDTTSADPLNGWFDKTAIGAQSIDITIQPPGIPSAEAQGLPKVFQIVAAPGIPSAETQGAPFVAALVEPPGIPSAETTSAGKAAIVITPAAIPAVNVVAAGSTETGISPPAIPSDAVVASGVVEASVTPPGIPSAEVEAPGEVASPPPPPTSTAAHGGWPTTRAPRPSDHVWPEHQPPGTWGDGYGGDEPFFVWPDAAVAGSAEQYPWLEQDAYANDGDAPLSLGLIDHFGPMPTLPENELLVAGNVGERSPWVWVAAGVALGAGVAWWFSQNGKKPSRKTSKRAPKSAPRRVSAERARAPRRDAVAKAAAHAALFAKAAQTLPKPKKMATKEGR